MKYLVIGSGGREHAIAWKLQNEDQTNEIFVMPGNGGIATEYRVKIDYKNHEKVIQFCKEKNIDLVAVGPEVPLVDGLVDSLTEAGIRAFGPTKRAAQLEGSKLFAKKIMQKYNVPTADYYECSSRNEVISRINEAEKYPLVIKLDGLAAGKGVGIPQNKDEAITFIEENYIDGGKIFIEEFLTGEEISVIAVSDGKTVKPLIASQDHKRAFDGDKGPNTGGMGAYGPPPAATPEILQKVQKEVLEPTIAGMAKEGMPFKGVLYAGIIVDNGEINVLEFNARFGDPETQVILPLMENSLGSIFDACIDGNLDTVDVSFYNKFAITVVLASGGYPGKYETGKIVSGLLDVKDVTVFHAGTDIDDCGNVVTAGGRVFSVTAVADSLNLAHKIVYSEIDKIKFEKKFCRNDIAFREFNR